MEKKKIAVIFGGKSPEYSISLQSSYGILSNMDRDKYEPVAVGITSEGKWHYFSGEFSKIADDTWFNTDDCLPAALSTDPGKHELITFGSEGLKKIEIDAVFPVLHGKNGEDGTVQGLCELSGIPLVGCGTLASALCMDKDRAHKLVQLAGIRVPKSISLCSPAESEKAADFADSIGYPVFVKSVKTGSSYGVTKVEKREEIAAAVAFSFEFDDTVLVEEGIDGFEVGCAVMGNREIVTGEIDEIELVGGFFNFTEKYNLITSKIHVPARISNENSEALKQAAKVIYKALDCRGFARVDMFLNSKGEIVFNEVNTIPGFTSHSRFPKMMAAAGCSFPQVIDSAISLAFDFAAAR